MAQDFASNGCYIGASHIGNRPEMLVSNFNHTYQFTMLTLSAQAMFDLASKQNIKSWIHTVDISEEGCKEAVTAVSENTVRYRYVLTNYDKAFGKRD